MWAPAWSVAVCGYLLHYPGKQWYALETCILSTGHGTSAGNGAAVSLLVRRWFRLLWSLMSVVTPWMDTFARFILSGLSGATLLRLCYGTTTILGASRVWDTHYTLLLYSSPRHGFGLPAISPRPLSRHGLGLHPVKVSAFVPSRSRPPTCHGLGLQPVTGSAFCLSRSRPSA